jgi:hypothetical protein
MFSVKKSVGIILLLAGVLLVAGAKTAQKGNLRITAKAQGNCAPIIFNVTNDGRSNSGAFKITVTSQAGEVVHTFYIQNMEARETLTLDYQPVAFGLFTISVDPDNALNEVSREDNVVKVETRCNR